MQMTVGDGGDVSHGDAGICQGVLDPPGGRVISLVELLVAEPETRIEQEDAAPVADRVTHDDALPMGQLGVREAERSELEWRDLGASRHLVLRHRRE